MAGGNDEGNLLLVGKILRAHGNNGAVIIRSDSDLPGRFSPGGFLLYISGKGELKKVKIKAAAGEKNHLILEFEGICDRDAARQLQGCEILAKPMKVPLHEGEYWVHELIGLNVFSIEGESVGVIKDVLFGKGQEILEVEREEKCFLIPFVREFIKKIDLEERQVVVDLIDGLRS
ncbi:MAG: ribosome maturation factor RimM [Actinomycetota bacterium]|nr:ribosome maturation factor RimM [Actinomycetota bacterium]